MAGIFVISDNWEGTRELLTAGFDLATKLGTRLCAFAADAEQAQEFIVCGADEVFLLPPLSSDQPFEAYLPILADAAKDSDPEVILIGATTRGKEIAARLAIRLDTGLCSGCTNLELDGDRLKMNRMVYGGAGVQTVCCATRPRMATVPPRTFEPAAVQEGRQGTVTELKAAPQSAVKVIGRSLRQCQAVDIREAKVVVCVGRGLEKAKDLGLAQELAKAVRGEVGCSRPIAEELNWMPEELYLGISGKQIKPDLYIGVGVSGQVQHVTGIRDSKVIFAINRDENAPIFEAADYGIVGDLYKVVPLLIEELKTTLKG